MVSLLGGLFSFTRISIPIILTQAGPQEFFVERFKR